MHASASFLCPVGAEQVYSEHEERADRLSIPLLTASLSISFFLLLSGEMMDSKWLAFPDSRVETWFSLCPSAGLCCWSDDSGNTEWGLNRVRDRWVKSALCVYVWLAFSPVTAKPKSEPDLCYHRSPQGQNPSGSCLKCHLSLSAHSFFWQSALPPRLPSSHTIFSNIPCLFFHVSRQRPVALALSHSPCRDDFSSTFVPASTFFPQTVSNENTLCTV